jgi:Tfp pilus assembly protein PilE
MLRNRKGVTLIEIMTVVALAVAMTAIAFPKLKETRRASSMQSARTQVESYLAVARSVAIRNGVRAFLVREGNTIRIMADSANGTIVTVVRPVELDSVSQVALGATKDTIIYDSRGLAVNLNASGEKFYITSIAAYSAGVKDSICVTRLGLVLDRKCGLGVTPPEKETADSIGIIDETVKTVEEITGPIVSP